MCFNSYSVVTKFYIFKRAVRYTRSPVTRVTSNSKCAWTVCSVFYLIKKIKLTHTVMDKTYNFIGLTCECTLYKSELSNQKFPRDFYSSRITFSLQCLGSNGCVLQPINCLLVVYNSYFPIGQRTESPLSLLAGICKSFLCVDWCIKSFIILLIRIFLISVTLYTVLVCTIFV